MAEGVMLTAAVAKVLRPFLEEPEADRYGFELMQLAGLPSGTLYPILARLERAGWLTSHREVVDPSEAGRPTRRFYRISAEGALAAQAEMNRLESQFRFVPGWPLRPLGGEA